MKIKEEVFENKKILIYGFGKSGKSAFHNLKKKNQVKIFDDNNINLSKLLKKYFLNKKKITSITFDYILLSPGINRRKCGLKNYLKKNNKKIISDLDVFYIKNKKNFKFTITGTNGKSTCCKLLYDILKKKFKDVRLAGNIGKPILSEKKIKPKTIFVIEASSYQIEYSKYFKTNYGIILNIQTDHLERHITMNNYIKAKFKLLKNQDENGLAFIDQNCNLIRKHLYKNKIKSKIVRVNNLFPKNIKNKIKNPYFLNKNNINNLKFIFEIAKNFRIEKKDIITAVNSFKALKFRQQTIYQNNKVVIINDSKSTSFSSSINLLKLKSKIYWIVGGLYKKGDKFILDKKYYKNIKTFIYGKYKNFFIKKLNNIDYSKFKNLELALKGILKEKEEKYTLPIYIIFSPASASFDEFKNFEDRGLYFNNLIKKLNFINKLNAKLK